MYLVPVQYSIAILHGFALLTQSWESPTGRLQASSTSVLTANVRSHEYFRTVFCWSWQVTHLVREGRRYPEVGALDISRCFAVDSNNWRKGRYLASICWSYINTAKLRWWEFFEKDLESCRPHHNRYSSFSLRPLQVYTTESKVRQRLTTEICDTSSVEGSRCSPRHHQNLK